MGAKKKRSRGPMHKQELTQAQEAFVFCYTHGMDVAECFRHSFPSGKDLNPKQCYERGLRVLKGGNVQRAIREAVIDFRRVRLYTMDLHLTQLTKLRELAIQGDDVKTAVKAEELIGKAMGWQVNTNHIQMEVNVQGQQAIQHARALLDMNPELRQKLLAEKEVEGEVIEAKYEEMDEQQALDAHLVG